MCPVVVRRGTYLSIVKMKVIHAMYTLIQTMKTPMEATMIPVVSRCWILASTSKLEVIHAMYTFFPDDVKPRGDHHESGCGAMRGVRLLCEVECTPCQVHIIPDDAEPCGGLLQSMCCAMRGVSQHSEVESDPCLGHCEPFEEDPRAGPSSRVRLCCDAVLQSAPEA